MKKINFKEIKYRPSLLAKEAPIKDFHKQIANAVWQNARDISASKFALKLFDNPEIELTDEEVDLIKSAIGDFYQWAKDAVMKALGEKDV